MKVARGGEPGGRIRVGAGRGVSPRVFIGGLTAGVVAGFAGGLLGMVLLAAHGWVLLDFPAGWGWESLWSWIRTNLRGALLPFLVLLFLYGLSLVRLRSSLRRRATLAEIYAREQLLDLWIGLFFGVGVIWTAVGMRDALLFALGDLDADTAAALGAFVILQRLVEGGILLALTTTIVGGMGGYLMRVLKALLVAAPMARRLESEGRQQAEQVETLLRGIHERLGVLVAAPLEPPLTDRGLPVPGAPEVGRREAEPEARPGSPRPHTGAAARRSPEP